MATFVAVNDSGSFTAAAEALSIPKARASQRVAALEAELGVRLINRTTRSLRLTDDGASYLDRCRAVLLEIEEVEGALRGGAVEPRGRLRVDALVSVARWILAPRLHEFQQSFPQIELRLNSSDRISHFLEEGVDCAIRGGEMADSTVVARQVCSVHFGLYAAPSHLAEHGVPSNPGELSTHRQLSWFSTAPFQWHLEANDGTAMTIGDGGIQFNDPDVAIEACLAGGGVCPGAPFAVEHLVRSGRLLPVLPAWSFPARPISVVYPSSRHLSRRVRCFVDWFVAMMESNPSIALTPQMLASLTIPPTEGS